MRSSWLAVATSAIPRSFSSLTGVAVRVSARTFE
jgi:hypothetical protein